MTYRVRQLILLVGDLICLYFGLHLAIFARNPSLADKTLNDLFEPMFVLFFIALIILYISGIYDIPRAKNTWNFYQRLLASSIAWIIIGIAYFYLRGYQYITPKTILALTAVFGFGFISIWRFSYNKFLSNVIHKTNIVFAGLTDETLEIIQIIQKTPELGYQILGIVETNHTNSLLSLIQGISINDNINSIREKHTDDQIHLIVVSGAQNFNKNLMNELYHDLFKQIEVVEETDFFEKITGRIPPITFSETWFLTNFHEQQKKVYDRIKILIDYAVSVLMSIFFVLTFPFIAILIKINSRGSIFYKQERVGKNGKIFKIYKYRTMRVLNKNGSAETGGPQWAGEKDARVTGVGKFLRRARFDEIPQFINILRGEMSLIGPRPERPEFVAQLKEKMPFYDLRHLVKPGLTGWAQLQENYYGTMEENLRKLEYDLFYVKNRNWLLDLIISLRTINVVLKMAGR